MPTRLVCGLFVLTLLAPACAGDSPGGRDGAGAGASGGASSPAAGGSGGGFGNPDPSQQGPASSGDAGPACMLGVRCAPVEPDPDDCGSLTLEGDVETLEMPGNVIVIFDRSGSMDAPWNGVLRWEAAGKAVTDALTPISDLLTVGAVFFPSPDDMSMPADAGTSTCSNPYYCPGMGVGGGYIGGGTCAVNPISAVDQIDFRAGASFLADFSGDPANNVPPRYAPVQGGRTPLLEGLQRADEALGTAVLAGSVTAIVITDGAPNCNWNQQTAIDIVTGWAGRGIATYVVGLPDSGGGFAGGAGATSVLTALAQAGGTMQYLTPLDAVQLQTELGTIFTQTISVGLDSCSINLSPPAEAPEKLHLVVTEGGQDKDVPRDLGQDASWDVTADGSTAELKGSLCEDAKTGRFSQVRFEFGCVDLPMLPPQPPVE